MNNLFVYCEIEEGNVADVSLELLTKGRSLANQLNCQLEAVVAGSSLKDIEKQILPYGVDKLDRKSTRLNSSHGEQSRMPSSA